MDCKETAAGEATSLEIRVRFFCVPERSTPDVTRKTRLTRIEEYLHGDMALKLSVLLTDKAEGETLVELRRNANANVPHNTARSKGDRSGEARNRTRV